MKRTLTALIAALACAACTFTTSSRTAPTTDTLVAIASTEPAAGEHDLRDGKEWPELIQPDQFSRVIPQSQYKVDTHIAPGVYKLFQSSPGSWDASFGCTVGIGTKSVGIKAPTFYLKIPEYFNPHPVS